MIVTTTTKAVELESRCAKSGCEKIARWMVATTSEGGGINAATFACSDHRGEQEAHSLRMFADALDRLGTLR